MNPKWSLWRGLVERSRFIVDRDVDVETFRKPMPGERVVFQWRRSGSYRCNVFHHTDYIRDAWGGLLDVVDILREASDYQDVVVLRKG